jgi:hypothetical protein
MHEVNPGEGMLCGVKELKPLHGTHHPFHATMVLLDNIGE